MFLQMVIGPCSESGGVDEVVEESPEVLHRIKLVEGDVVGFPLPIVSPFVDRVVPHRPAVL